MTILTTRSTFSRSALLAAPLLLSLCAGHATAKVPAAFDRVPADAAVVIATGNVEALGTRVRKYAELLEVPGTDAIGGFVDQLLGTPGIKKDGSAALVLPVIEGDSSSDPFEQGVLIAEVSDYPAMVKELGGDPAAKVAQVKGPEGEELFARDLGGGWMAMGPDQARLESFVAGEKMLETHTKNFGVVGRRAAESSDVLVVTNMAVLAPKFSKGIDDGVVELKKELALGRPPLGEVDAETVTRFLAPFEKIAKAFVRDAQICVLGVGLGEAGMTIDVGAQFKDSSEIAGFYAKAGDAETHLTSLPATPYLFAVSVDSSAPGTRQVLKNTAALAEETTATIKQEIERRRKDPAADVEQLDMVAKQIEAQTAGIRSMSKYVDKLDGTDMIFSYSPASLAGAGLFSGMITQTRGTDTAALRSMFQEQIKGASLPGMEIETTFKEGAAEVAGSKLDSWTAKPKMDPNDPAAAQMAMVNMFMYGSTGQMSGHVATLKDRLIITSSPNTQVMEQAIKASKGEGSLAADKGVTTATSALPKGSMVRGLLGTKTLLDIGQMALSFTGQPVQLKVPADVPPIAMGMTGDGGGVHIRFHAPSATLKTLSEVARQVQEMQQGGDEEPMEEEKPRF